MPNRILRDGILSSPRISSLSFGAQLFYYRLLSLVDDYGRYTANPQLLRVYGFPLQLDRVSMEDCERWMDECQTVHLKVDEDEPLLRVYEVGGKRFLELSSFDQRVRAKESKYPPRPAEVRRAPANDGHVSTVREHVTAQTEAKTIDVDGIAERMYAAHPVKRNKPLAEMELVQVAEAGVDLKHIESVHSRWCSSKDWKRDGGRWVPALDKWLRDEGWTQEPPDVRAKDDGPRYVPLGGAA